MGNDNKKKSTANHKKKDGTFHSKHIKHNPMAESTRAVFGLVNENDGLHERKPQKKTEEQK